MGVVEVVLANQNRAAISGEIVARSGLKAKWF
jgi:hypothetical protein